MKTTRRVLKILLILAVTLAGLYGYFLYAPKPPAPSLSASLQQGSLEVSGRTRDYAYYLPAKLPANAPLLFVLHGSLQTLDDIRTFSAYEFEHLADEHGFEHGRHRVEIYGVCRECRQSELRVAPRGPR